MAAVRVTLLYNEPTLPADHPDADSEHDVLETVDVIAKHLQAAGLQVSRLGTTGDPKALLIGLEAAKPDVVFNLFEGTAGWGRSEEYVAGVLELLKLPYTGCPTLPMTLCRDKPLAKRLFAGAGIPTAPYVVIPEGPIPPCPMAFPVIVKPGQEDASVGIDQKSVCRNQAELEERIEYLRRRYGPSILVEQLIVGREFHVPVIERDGQIVVLPFSEILFPPPADGLPIWPIVTFDAKWKPNSRDFAATPAKNPADVDDHLRRCVTEIVVKTFQLLDCRDYARVDLRVDESGKPFVLEMNPNPCINPLAGVAAALESAKIPYAEFLQGCVRNALRRAGRADGSEIGTASPSSPLPHRTAFTICPASSAISIDAFDPVMSASDRGMLSGIAAKPLPADAWIAEQDGQPVGILAGVPLDATNGVWAIERIMTSERRKGIGHALMEALEKGIFMKGGRLIIADVTSSPGFAAVRSFLTAVGFVPIGDCPEYYRDGYSQIRFGKHLPAVVESGTRNAEPTAAVGRAVTGAGML